MRKLAVAMMVVLALLWTSTAQASIIWFSPLDPTAAPPGVMGPYALFGAGDDTRPNGQFVSDVGGLDFSQPVIHTEVGAGWATWSHGYTGDVYHTVSSGDPLSLTMTLPDGVHAFYFYAEPNQFLPLSMTAILDGSGVFLTQVVQGFAGAKFFGVYDDAGGELASVTLSMIVGSGFAVGEFGADSDLGPDPQIGDPVPEPGTLVMLGLGLLGIRRRFGMVA